MIIPSIDIQNGQTVQLVGGQELAIEAGDPKPLAEKFGRVGEVAVIDLDAAMSTGNNAELINSLLPIARCRIGGGIRDVATAIDWLDAGAAKIILGTAAKPELLRELPKDRVIAALDAVHGEVVDHGWQRQTGSQVVDCLKRLTPYVGAFLITFIEREGRMTGIDVETIKQYQAAAGDAKLTIAGGVATAEEIAVLDTMGIDAQIGMALYRGDVSLAAGFCSSLKSDRSDGLWPTVVTNQAGQALGLAYSNLESVERSLESGDAHYWSRKRGLWRKGASSGNTQKLRSIASDCDRDCLMFTVEQSGVGFCHLNRDSCFGDLAGVSRLEQLLKTRLENAPEGSYSRRLFIENGLLDAKLVEEVNEFVAANNRAEMVHEAADVLFFTMAKLVKNKIAFREIEAEINRRALKVTRRNGDAKVELPR